VQVQVVHAHAVETQRAGQILPSAASIGVRGATQGVSSSGRDASGLGRAPRSTLPVSVRGIRESHTMAEGSIGAGSVRPSPRRSADTEGVAPGVGTI